CPSHAPATAHAPPRDRPQTCPAPEQPRRCRTCGGGRVFLGRLSPHTREPPEGQREGPILQGWRPAAPRARPGGLDPVGTTCGDLSGLRTTNPMPPGALSASHG